MSKSFKASLGRASDYMAYLLTIAFGIVLLVHFVLIAIYGSVVISEHCKFVLYSEIATSIIILAFGLTKFKKFLSSLQAK